MHSIAARPPVFITRTVGFGFFQEGKARANGDGLLGMPAFMRKLLGPFSYI